MTEREVKNIARAFNARLNAALGTFGRSSAVVQEMLAATFLPNITVTKNGFISTSRESLRKMTSIPEVAFKKVIQETNVKSVLNRLERRLGVEGKGSTKKRARKIQLPNEKDRMAAKLGQALYDEDYREEAENLFEQVRAGRTAQIDKWYRDYIDGVLSLKDIVDLIRYERMSETSAHSQLEREKAEKYNNAPDLKLSPELDQFADFGNVTVRDWSKK